jgi:hypothetical protein
MSFKLSSDIIASQVFPTNAADFREAVKKEQESRRQQREVTLAAQASPGATAYERIRVWEQLHALRLPSAPNHSLVQVIADQTRLTITQIHQEQERRATAIARLATT